MKKLGQHLETVMDLAETLGRFIRLYVIFSGYLLAVIVPVTLSILVYKIVQVERIPGVVIERITADQFVVEADSQIKLTTTLDVHESCVASLSRGLARKDPADSNNYDIQILASAPLPNTASLLALDSDKGSVLVQDRKTDVRHVHVTSWLALPTSLQKGDGWHYVEVLSQQACGWFHGWLPITTTTLIGPPVVIR
ncbi:MAG: hypothetical protein ACRYGR_09385 [Janthinobacterium lividum]